MAHPTYLRVVVTTRCNLACSYCHAEGDLATASPELPLEDLGRCFAAAELLGIRKLKFLGGEPFLRSDIAAVVSSARAALPNADLSAITAGALPTERLLAAYAAGLDRVNVSIHGFGPAAFAQRNNKERAYQQRQEFLATALELGRPIKLNFVYSSMVDRPDLAALLDWAAPRGVLVNVLDNLNVDLTWQKVAQVVRSLRGAPARETRCPDPDSLETLHLEYADGLRVEIKNQNLGALAPFRSCQTCPKRTRCKEGIYALRLTHRGYLQPCMDRTDLSFPLAEVARERGVSEAAAAAFAWLEGL
jgi:cyclic pyranopterin phosphate synthase